MLTGQFRKKMQGYHNFIRKYHGKKLVILEFGVGWRNRMIKEPLMQLTAAEPHSAISHSIKGKSIFRMRLQTAPLEQTGILLPRCTG